MDPRAAGPQTLVALQAVDRLLAHGSLAALLVNQTPPLWEGVAQGVLSCKFEQTDAAQDEAVEMAIATVLFRDHDKDGICRFASFRLHRVFNDHKRWSDPYLHVDCPTCPAGEASCGPRK